FCREIGVHCGGFGPKLKRDRTGDFHILCKRLGGINKHVIAVFRSALVARTWLVVLSVAAEGAADGGHRIRRIVCEFVRRFFFGRRNGKATVAAQRIGRTARV